MSLVILAQNITDQRIGTGDEPLDQSQLALSRDNGTADYDVEVSINRRRFIWVGKIKNHVRAEGASKLLRLIADAMDKEN